MTTGGQSTCWYCGESPGDASATVKMAMYRETSRIPTGEGRWMVHWQTLTLVVPRCARCKRISTQLTAVGAVLSAPLPIYAVIWSLRDFPTGLMAWLIWLFIRFWIFSAAFCVFLLSMWILGWPGRLVARALRSRLVPVSGTLSELRAKGWRDGARPTGVSDQTTA